MDPVVRDATPDEVAAKRAALTAPCSSVEEIQCDPPPTVRQRLPAAPTGAGPRVSAADAAEKRRAQAEADPAEQERKKQRLADAARDKLETLQGEVVGRMKLL